MNTKVFYHSRHIPVEHLRLDKRLGKKCYDNLLADSIDSPCVEKLCDYGIDIVETRLVWNELEPEPGKYDFSRFERDIEKIKKRGLGVGVFPWFQHPPKWFNDAVRLKCPEHGEESTFISIWDGEKLLEIYDRLYAELAKRYKDVIDFVYVGIYSDYGEVCMPLGIEHYVFSPSHICKKAFGMRMNVPSRVKQKPWKTTPRSWHMQNGTPILSWNSPTKYVQFSESIFRMSGQLCP